MATRTITAMFDTRPEAEQAVLSLVSEAGLDRSAVRLDAAESAGAAAGASGQADKGFFASLKDMFIPEEDRHTYAEGIRRGGVMVSAQVDEARLDKAMDVLERHGAVDLDEREAAWKREGWTGYGAGTGAVVGASSDGTSTGVAAMPAASSAPGTRSASAGAAAQSREEVIPIAEERLTVGKREVGRGRVRARSYVVETPVQEQVTLRQEHVDIERRPVDRPVTAADEALFQERTLEATESAEEAVVAKEARVVEEVALRKGVDERVQTVQDTVRRTEVEIEDERRTAGTGGTTAAPGTSAAKPKNPDRR